MPADREFKADIFQRTAAQWTAENPFLSENDLCVESDTGRMKVGTGLRWGDTSYIPLTAAAGAAPVQSVNGQTGNVVVKKLWWM